MGRVYTPGADFAEAVGKTYDISTQYGVDINKGLEGCLSLTVKNIAAEEGVSCWVLMASDLKAPMNKYKVNL